MSSELNLADLTSKSVEELAALLSQAYEAQTTLQSELAEAQAAAARKTRDSKTPFYRVLGAILGRPESAEDGSPAKRRVKKGAEHRIVRTYDAIQNDPAYVDVSRAVLVAIATSTGATASKEDGSDFDPRADAIADLDSVYLTATDFAPSVDLLHANDIVYNLVPKGEGETKPAEVAEVQPETAEEITNLPAPDASEEDVISAAEALGINLAETSDDDDQDDDDE